MTLFFLLLLAHLMADFLQPASLVRWSKSGVGGLLVHTTIYAGLTALVLAGRGPYWWGWLTVLALAHFLLDRLKYWLAPRLEPVSVLLFLIDQLLHIGVIAGVAFGAGLGHFAPSIEMGRLLSGQRAIAYTVFYVTVALAGSIFVFETARTFVPARDSNNGGVIGWRDRLLGMTERAGALTLVLVKWYVFAPLAFLPSLILLIVRWRSSERSRRLVELAASLLVTAIVVMLATTLV